MWNWFFGLCDAPISADLTDIVQAADLATQKQMACWAGLSFGGTILSVVLSALALIGLFISLELTRRSITHTRELGQAQTRAYVHAASAGHLWDNTDGSYTVLLWVENVGETPAKVFEIGATLKKVRQGQITSSIKAESYEMKAWSALGPKLKPTSVRLDLQKFTELAREFRSPVEDHVILLTGTIRYQDIFDRWFETDFALYTHATNPKGPEAHIKFRRPTAQIRSYEKAA
ncbi:hypothetical protein [Rhizobium sp. P44RR-XXIV]|uniref:hypothetical protein n=1 Tax=Rhizobium sp. P44RR-XXIV TaxID=1921145 RepID=UPI0009853329|nr:hypothetical protein [Rhizobium sp. P44RR-XXIV]TIX89169.1 hypothetical protein BSK43_021420 [Rhizobium sp. P44RR-XXIV]